MNILFPAECLACGAPLARGTLCGTCRMCIAPHRTAFCGTCAAPLPGLRSICHPHAPHLLGAAGDYRNAALRTLIHALKFGRMRCAAEPLADVLIHYCARLPMDLRGFSVVPVPISRERMRERGFNQSALIAERFARFFGAPLRTKLLSRTVHRTAQSDIPDRDERRENIRDCYAAKEFAGSGICAAGRNIILIDDVTTSGATFADAVRALRSAGARKIFALAVAKAR
ncbi:MAG: double zinc ribbon domain-containing protein [Candidatus Pacebacteria bacterium]|nr:double zinc ribbon domain-containing protein [Candidatus Paceibacterota bacterium]